MVCCFHEDISACEHENDISVSILVMERDIRILQKMGHISNLNTDKRESLLTLLIISSKRTSPIMAYHIPLDLPWHVDGQGGVLFPDFFVILEKTQATTG